MSCPLPPKERERRAAWSDKREAKVPGTGCGHKIFNAGCLQGIKSQAKQEAAA